MTNAPAWKTALPALRAIYGRFWREARWMLAGIALVVLAYAVIGVATPYVFSRLVDALGVSDLASGLAWMFVGYAVLRGLAQVLGYSVNFLSTMAAENLNFIAATSFFTALLRKPGSFFIDHNPVEIQSARGEGQAGVAVILQLGIIVFIPGVTQIVLAIALLGAVINLEIVIIVGVYGLTFVTLTYAANRWTRQWLDKAIKANQENAQFVGNAVNAMEALRYFNGDRWISRRFSEKADLSRRSWHAWAKRRMVLAGLFGTALATQLAITYVLLLPRFDAGLLSVGDIVLINLILVQLNQPFEMIGIAIDDVVRSLTRFVPFATMWNVPDDTASVGGSTLVAGEGRLEFAGVGFRYGERQTLKDVSFVAAPGAITFITGNTGSGKSTLFKLALKSLQPTEGRITVDGMDLASIDRESWYSQVGVVPQDVILLNDSLEANIVLGRVHDAARLREAAAQASILEFIEGLPEGFATTVGERGLKLSGGERQRVSIARALYGQLKVLFLDEASSALDERTESEIMGELRRLVDRVTILAITHRRSVIGARDRLVVLAGGSAPAMEDMDDENTAVGQDGV
jgi:ABC-type bacteriocin/lantibiotic exporter with double-glycine peptidase domain